MELSGSCRTMARVLLVIWGVLFFAIPVEAEGLPTKVLVRAVSRDAKVLGTYVGGARITIRDLKHNKILAQGLQQGGTGDTMQIMIRPRQRGDTVYGTQGTAGFLSTLTLEKPTVVEITAEGPLNSPQATQRSSKTLLLVPGQDILGEGVLLEIHGFIVTLLSPERNKPVSSGRPLEVVATVVMS